ncbi:glycosyltransferase [Silvibacterium acidisoli]|uniref:glycosyltransferase n=1 Tax=Acidobacteriaceae bacterium ZG23-2 TaxID=2883246 RepID=UPI00406D42F9
MHTVLLALAILTWLLALAWIFAGSQALFCLPRMPDLRGPRYAAPLPVASGPQLAVIVPARNEEDDVEECLQSLLAIEGIEIEILAVDDRSTDATGGIMDRVAARGRASGKRISVMHIAELPDGWMGKTHALALAARQATARWLLFTDADIIFAPDSLHRAMNFALSENADHAVLFPTLLHRTAGEKMMNAIYQVTGLTASRAWKVADPKSRATIGVGAFNLVRAEAYRAVGGFENLRLEVLEDLRLGYELKKAGFRQRVAFGPGLVSVHWAEGAGGLMRNITKNAFAVFRFRVRIAFPALMTTSLFLLWPLLALFGPWSLRIPALVCCGMIAMLYRLYERWTAVPVRYMLTYPLAAPMLVYAVFRSIIVTLVQGGIRWRGTFYDLSELRRRSGPIR